MFPYPQVGQHVDELCPVHGAEDRPFQALVVVLVQDAALASDVPGGVHVVACTARGGRGDVDLHDVTCTPGGGGAGRRDASGRDGRAQRGYLVEHGIRSTGRIPL